MSVENKVKELLSRKDDQQLTEATEGDTGQVMQGSSEKPSFEKAAKPTDAGKKASSATTKDTSKSAAAGTQGDTTQPMQGSSQKASYAEHDEEDSNLGAKASASVSKDTTLPKSKGDAKSVKTAAMEEEEVEGEAITEEETVDIESQLNAIFGEELSEDFKSKATSIFEAAVIARVNSEMETVVAKLEEQNEVQMEEFKASIVEKVDSYLNYVVEQWMEENALAVESGLRTEITEDFISGLKTLFQEHYIEVPEEKYDVLEELQSTTEELEAKLNESIEHNIAFAKELSQLKAEKVFEEHTKDLAATEVEKLKKLVEGVDFENEDLYREKVTVIKENYFPKVAKTSPEKVLVEESGTDPAAFNDNNIMNKYVQALSRTVKAR